MGTWSEEIFGSDTAMDALDGVFARIAQSLRKDLDDAAEDGILDRPTLAYAATLRVILKGIPESRMLLPKSDVSKWRSDYLDWVAKAEKDLADSGYNVRKLKRQAKKQFDGIEALADMPDDFDGPLYDGSEREDDEDEEYEEEYPILSWEETLKLLLENWESKQQDFNEVDEEIYYDCPSSMYTLRNLSYLALRDYPEEYGELLWHTGQSPVEYFRRMLDFTPKWMEFVTEHEYSLSYIFSELALPVIVEFLLDDDRLFHCITPTAECFEKPVLGTPYRCSRLDWLLVERLRGTERPDLWARVFKEGKKDLLPEFLDAYRRYHELILAGQARAADRAGRIIEEQAQWFEKPKPWSHVSTRDENGKLKLYRNPYTADVRMAAIIKAFKIPYDKPCVHVWRW